MDPISRSDLRQLIDIEQEPCVSIYFPTHRAGVHTLQDPIRLKNLIREAERRLEERGDQAPVIREAIEPLRELVDQHEFWQHQADGLAVFRSRDIFRRYRVSFSVPELAVVARRFHLKPLLPAVEANQRFRVLALSQDAAKVYEANHQSITEIEIQDMPESPISPGVRSAERQLQSHTAGHQSSKRRFAIFHGHGADEEDRKQLLLSYFRRVDDTVRKTCSDEHTPVVLAAVDYLCPIYRQASSNPNLLTEEIHGNPSSFPSEELHRLAWGIASSHFQEDRTKAADEYHQLWHTQRASKDLSVIVTAARQGRVKVLFVAVGVQEWGHVDPSSAEVVQVGQRSSQDQDLLNVAAMETFIAGGTVYAVPPDEVPGRGSVAAVFRY
ncbi:MAG TPA: hypothetical protein VLE22_02110 [Bryobacteraceae bacterium]|nr:hypothetical protein [Bryobacteraceae bacterium]